jgi:hypothetical protein
MRTLLAVLVVATLGGCVAYVPAHPRYVGPPAVYVAPAPPAVVYEPVYRPAPWHWRHY